MQLRASEDLAAHADLSTIICLATDQAGAQFTWAVDHLALPDQQCCIPLHNTYLLIRSNKEGFVTMARMKVLLTQDVPELGLAGEVYTVAGGYARNYLMPRGYAVVATKGALRQAEEIRQAGIRRRAQERANAEAQAQVIAGQRLLFTANAGENERLYGSVTAAEISERLSEACGFEIDRRRLLLDHPIRQLGTYDLVMRLMADVTPAFTVAVVREGEGWQEAEARVAAAAAAAAAEAAAERAEQEAAAAAAEAPEDDGAEEAAQ